MMDQIGRAIIIIMIVYPFLFEGFYFLYDKFAALKLLFADDSYILEESIQNQISRILPL